MEVKRGSLFNLSHYFFIWVSPTLHQTLGGITRGRRRKAMLRFLDKERLKLFCLVSQDSFVLKRVYHACVVFRIIEYLCKTLVSYITFLTGAFYFTLFQHICVISETGKQKYKA